MMKGLTIAFGLFLSCLGLLYFGFHLRAVFFINPRYAEAVFEPYFGQFETLESRRWHAFGELDWACTYAIVELPADSAQQPPDRLQNKRHWQLSWGGDWVATPMPALPDNTRDTFGFCADQWSAEVALRIERALSAPGSFVAIGSVGETVHLYSAPQRIAARVRFGD